MNSSMSKLSKIIAAYRERRYRARQRFLALEDRFKTIPTSDACYATIKGIPAAHI